MPLLQPPSKSCLVRRWRAQTGISISTRVIEFGELLAVRGLSRRRRYAAMAFDVSDDIAVTMFARRSVGCMVEETLVFSRHSGRWEILGGGGGPLDDCARSRTDSQNCLPDVAQPLE